jgi:hypothetical protein
MKNKTIVSLNGDSIPGGISFRLFKYETGFLIAVLGTYYSTWLSSMIGIPNFVVGIDPIRCSGENCTAIFLPEGVEQIRLYKKNEVG